MSITRVIKALYIYPKDQIVQTIIQTRRNHRDHLPKRSNTQTNMKTNDVYNAYKRISFSVIKILRVGVKLDLLLSQYHLN